MSLEGFRPTPRVPQEATPDLEDYRDNEELYGLLTRLPAELRAVHLKRIEHLEDEKATGYLYALHERREAALRESVVSDPALEPYFTAHQQEIWKALETRVFEDAGNHVGAGTTARVKRFDLDDAGEGDHTDIPPVAVKYLVTPTEKTLSVSGEHDLILELEQLRKIEIAEAETVGENAQIRVPHPYFYYRKGKTQCYAMELIDGITLEKGMSGEYDPGLQDELRESLKGLDRNELFDQVDKFFDTMHGMCLHGDVKPRNLMVSKEGRFYVIDFGQSVLTTSVNEKAHEAFELLKDEEKRNAKDAIRFFLDKLYSN